MTFDDEKVEEREIKELIQGIIVQEIISIYLSKIPSTIIIINNDFMMK